MTDATKRRLRFAVRWTIAVVGIWWVVSNINFRDKVTILDPATNRPVKVRVENAAHEEDKEFRIIGAHGEKRTEILANLWVSPDRDAVRYTTTPGEKPVKANVLAIKPGTAIPGGHGARHIIAFLVEDRETKKVREVRASDIFQPRQMTVASPYVEVGLNRMVREARPGYLLAALLIVPLSYMLTSMRWYVLMRALDIGITQSRAFVLNMVGAFYNAFMPGTTGGDIIKAWYAAKHTADRRTQAVLTVIVDRVIGLLALVILGGAMAAYQWDVPDCRRVAVLSGILLGGVAAGLVVFYVRPLRTWTGLAWLLRKLPMQRQVRKAVDAMEIFGRRPGFVLASLMLSFPVHVITILSATFAGEAFGLPLRPFYYWVVVPVVALVGAIPVSPQGVGVMEYFAVKLTEGHGATVSQAFILTMSIRIVQIFWNLVAGIFVLRGGYHAPTTKEQEELEGDATTEVTSIPSSMAADSPMPPNLGTAEQAG